MTYEEAMKKLDKDYGNKDNLIILSTISLSTNPAGKPQPAARIIDAVYIDGAYYVATYALSSKMKQIENNPEVFVCAMARSVTKNFTANGFGENLGWVRDEKNADIMTKVCDALKWFNLEGQNDPNSCLLRIKLTYGVWYNPHKGQRTEVNFNDKTIKELQW